MTNRYLDGERPAPGPAGALAATAAGAVRLFGERLDACLLHDALAALWGLVEEANRLVDAEKPWELAKATKAGDEAAAQRLRDVLGDLLEACRVVGLAVAPFMPATSPKVLAQLGHAYPYGPDGNGGPTVLDELGWAAHAVEGGRVTAPEPLFPRLDVDPVETGGSRSSVG
jgi:methionyl-tRNA synthetase